MAIRQGGLLGPGFWRVITCCALAGSIPQAWAQRASENVLESAQDAFGTTVGNESIGLYNARDVRGFDPVEAGNVRLEGLYFDRQQPNPQEVFISSLVSGSTVRVGLTAQSYLFPAPTGIADISLRIPGDEFVSSFVAGYGAYSKYSFEVNSEVPLISDKLNVTLGAGYIHDDTQDASSPVHLLGAVVGRWRPSDAVEVIPFWSRKNTDGMSPRPNIFTACCIIPPEIPRHVNFTQPWASNTVRDSNFGTIVNASLSDNWRLRAGLFRSLVQRKVFFNNLYQNTMPDGTADSVVVAYPPQQLGSYSGEVRLSGVMTAGDWRHTVHAAGRGRYVQRNFSGTASVALGRVTLGVPNPVPMPVFNFRPLNRDRTRQGTGGLSYEGIWAGVGEVSFGLQKTSYRRSLVVPATASTLITDTPWLPNATVAFHANDKVTVFGSYTRGLEESGQAPNGAANRGEALPAIRTSQVDAGVRWKITPGVTAVATAFQIEKPYLSLNNVNVFTNVGDVRHRGVEISVAGQVAEGVRIVAGAVFLQARVSGPLVEQGLLGKVPIGRTPRYGRFDIEYSPPFISGLSLDMQLDNRSSRVGTNDNLARFPARTLINLGGRYRFKVMDLASSLRFQVRNITDVFAWDINTNQLSFQPEEKRRYLLTLAVDF